MERDPVLDLAAFYAARGITPEQIRQMSYADRAVLRVGRARWYEDMINLIAAGVCRAYAPEEGRNSG